MARNLAILSIGSNTADKHNLVVKAIDEVKGWLIDSRATDSYLTMPLSGKGDCYLNAVVAGYTESGYDALNEQCKALEKAYGRNEECRNRGEVPIDVDIVVFDSAVRRQRDFVSDFFQRGYSILFPENARFGE